MNHIQNAPHVVLWMAIPLILLIALVNRNSALDITLHNNYLVISAVHISLGLSLGLLVMGLLYWWQGNTFLINWMTISHVCFTLVFFYS